MYILNKWKTNQNSAKCQICEINENEKSNIHIYDHRSQINVDTTIEYQEIEGFGGAYNEIGWEAVKDLSEKERWEVFNSLFGENGCRFALCRTPIGASDFALDAYSLNDVDGDLEMKHFSIDRDKKRLIPYILESFAVNPKIKVWGCPWSPPYWMKTNVDMCNGGELLDKPEILKSYAVYMQKYIEAYAKEGIEVYAVCIQNEVDVINIYPTSSMPQEMMKKFIRAYLVPELVCAQKKPIKTQIWAGTIRKDKEYAEAVVTDPVTKQFVKGIGYQYSSAEVVGNSYGKYSGIKLLHTEAVCHNGENSWAEAKEIFSEIAMYLKSGCVNYSYWNMILDESALSTWGWKQNSMIQIDRQTKEVKYNYEYYVMKHFSQFIETGAKRIEIGGNHEGWLVSFKNPDNSVVILLSNFSNEETTVDIYIDGENFKVTLESDSIYTLKFSKSE